MRSSTLVFRPSETLEDVYSRRVELQALEQRLTSSQPACSSAVEPDSIACPVGTTMLRDQCARCNAPLEELWQMCPYCATPVVPQQLNLDVAPAAEAKIALVDDTIPLVPQAERRRRRRLSNRERAGLPRALGISAPDRD